MKNFYQPGCCGCEMCSQLKLCHNHNDKVAFGIEQVQSADTPDIQLTIEGLTDHNCVNCDETGNDTWAFTKTWYNGSSTWANEPKQGKTFCSWRWGYVDSPTAAEHYIFFTGTNCTSGFFSGCAAPFIQLNINNWGEFNDTWPVGDSGRASVMVAGIRDVNCPTPMPGLSQGYVFAKILLWNQDLHNKFCVGEEIELTRLWVPSLDWNRCHPEGMTVKVKALW